MFAAPLLAIVLVSKKPYLAISRVTAAARRTPRGASPPVGAPSKPVFQLTSARFCTVPCANHQSSCLSFERLRQHEGYSLLDTRAAAARSER